MVSAEEPETFPLTGKVHGVSGVIEPSDLRIEIVRLIQEARPKIQ
jgi:hypothetical protein|tara:strand:- start:38 stop:172 length:135 start_codon:yes stop_codon:yes gene_type:complete